MDLDWNTIKAYLAENEALTKGFVKAILGAIIGGFILKFKSRSRYQELHAKYRHVNIQSMVLGVFLFIAVSGLVYGGLCGAAWLRNQWLGESKYLIEFGMGFQICGAVFCGLFLSIFVHHYILQARLGVKGKCEYQEYVTWIRHKHRPVLNAVASVICVTIAIAVCGFMLASYAKVTDQGLTVNGPLELKETDYAWSDVKQLQCTLSMKTPKGEVRCVEQYSVTFRDGNSYSLSRADTNLDLKRLRRLFRYISFQSGVNIETVDPYPRGRNPMVELMK
ncbi:hypothetical protein Rhal01_02165 [Rubritalea halochordaticola]|uniref:Uncharacterized protein n=1 Tax=Rubritalea halochordaticola TaxID=714537 RepID=A0ABP9V241_9BACT